jgi:hypothetical protein
MTEFIRNPSAEERLRHAKLSGDVANLAGVLGGDPERRAQLAEWWPELARQLHATIRTQRGGER